jgi:hypothetical protein
VLADKGGETQISTAIASRDHRQRRVAVGHVPSGDRRRDSEQSKSKSESKSIGAVGWMKKAAREFSIGKSSVVGMQRVGKVESLQEIINEIGETAGKSLDSE